MDYFWLNKKDFKLYTFFVFFSADYFFQPFIFYSNLKIDELSPILPSDLFPCAIDSFVAGFC